MLYIYSLSIIDNNILTQCCRYEALPKEIRLDPPKCKNLNR